MERYINNDLKNPIYLFHGSPKLLEVVEQRQAHDSSGNKNNEDFAVFLTSSFIIASAYAFKDRIKELSSDLHYDFLIGRNSDTKELEIIMNNVRIDDELEGYIYVFPFDPSFEHTGSSIQYKCYKNIVPIDVVKVKFSDFKQYYSINENIKKR